MMIVSVVLGSLFHPTHMYRALTGRVKDSLDNLPDTFKLNTPKFNLMTSKEVGRVILYKIKIKILYSDQTTWEGTQSQCQLDDWDERCGGSGWYEGEAAGESGAEQVVQVLHVQEMEAAGGE